MIIVKLDLIMAKRKIGLNQLSRLVGITPANLSRLKNGKCREIKLSTIDSICRVLNCDISDIFEFSED